MIQFCWCGQAWLKIQLRKKLPGYVIFFLLICLLHCYGINNNVAEETFLFEIWFHFSSMKTFPFGLFLMEHISVFQLNDPKSMNFFYNLRIFRISCVRTFIYYSIYEFLIQINAFNCYFSTAKSRHVLNKMK